MRSLRQAGKHGCCLASACLTEIHDDITFTLIALQLEDTQRLLSMAEGRLAHTDARAREAEAETAQMRGQLSNAVASLQVSV